MTQTIDPPKYTVDLEDGREERAMPADQVSFEDEKKTGPPPPVDAFGDEEFAEVKYKTLKWW